MSLILSLFLSIPIGGATGNSIIKLESSGLKGSTDTVIVQEVTDRGIYFAEILWEVNWDRVHIVDNQGIGIDTDELKKFTPFEAEVWIIEGEPPVVTAIKVLKKNIDLRPHLPLKEER